MSRTRHIAVLLALTAMLLRGYLPQGWMPDAQGAFTMCSVGGVHHNVPGQPPAKQDHDTVCPFAAVAHLASPQAFAFLPATRHETVIERPAPNTRSAAAASRHNPNIPRAPPSFA
jgi:hypothetical protein